MKCWTCRKKSINGKRPYATWVMEDGNSRVFAGGQFIRVQEIKFQRKYLCKTCDKRYKKETFKLLYEDMYLK